MKNLRFFMKFFYILFLVLWQSSALAQIEDSSNKAVSGQPKIFYVGNFQFIVKPIKYLQDTNELIAPSLNIFLDKELVFDLSNDPKQIDFTKIMFGTKLSEESNEILNLIGDGRSFYIVTTFTGGVRCCYSYYILELLENGIRLMQKLDTGGSPIEFIKNAGNNGYILKLKDMNFANFYSAYERSAFPEINLIYNPTVRHFVPNLLGEKISNDEFNNLVRKTSTEVTNNFEQYGELNIVINPILTEAIKLIYSGNADKAFELIDKTWPSNLKLFKKDNFVANLKCKLKSSSFWPEINNINPNLNIPIVCE